MSIYSIKELEKLSGIKAHTIRIWEKRYALLTPLRTDTNIRYYGDNELVKLLNVTSLISLGFKISKISIMSNDEINQQLDNLIDDIVYIHSKPGRIVVFSSHISHKACEISPYSLQTNKLRFVFAYHLYYPNYII